MIADDYDDMKLGLESRLGEMQYENRQIPALQENLEKSQQLVQQMIEKHKSEIDELATSNNDLHGQVDTLKSTLSVAARKDQSDNNQNKGLIRAPAFRTLISPKQKRQITVSRTTQKQLRQLVKKRSLRPLKKNSQQMIAQIMVLVPQRQQI